MEHNKKINVMLSVLGVLLILLIAFITLSSISNPNEYKYNGFTVSRYSVPSAPGVTVHEFDLFVGNHQYKIPIRTDPNLLEDIIIGNIATVPWIFKETDEENYQIEAEQIFLAFNPHELTGADTIIALGEVGRILGTADYSLYKIPTTGAFTLELEDSVTPVVSCKDTNPFTGIIKFQLGSTNEVFTEDNCIVVQGQDYDGLIKASDKLLLTLVGVITI